MKKKRKKQKKKKQSYNKNISKDVKKFTSISFGFRRLRARIHWILDKIDNNLELFMHVLAINFFMFTFSKKNVWYKYRWNRNLFMNYLTALMGRCVPSSYDHLEQIIANTSFLTSS